MSRKLVSLPESQIESKYRKGEATTVVFGLGWMGLSTACLYAEVGCKVIGVDKNALIVEEVNKAETPVDEKDLQILLRKHVVGGRLKATLEGEEAASKGDAILIIVPTRVDSSKKADYSELKDSSKTIGRGLKEESCVIVESTCAPNVTEEMVKPLLEKFSGMVAGDDFALAYSPIRAMAGRVISDLRKYPRVIGGLDKRSLKVASQIVSLISEGGLVKVKDIKTAEATKMFETIYRDVNIGLSNEFADLCEKLGIDYYEVSEAANTQPYSHLHKPGVGVGGHCLPVYPYLLASSARSAGARLKLVMDARRLNEDMPRRVVRLVKDGLRACRKSITRGDVTVLGITYRPNVKEIRYSPSLELIALLKRRGGRVKAYDPLYTKSEMEGLKLKSEPNLKMSLEGADCAIITVGHREFQGLWPRDFASTMDLPAAVIDASGVLDPYEIEKGGLVYRGVGRGVWSK